MLNRQIHRHTQTHSLTDTQHHQTKLNQTNTHAKAVMKNNEIENLTLTKCELVSASVSFSKDIYFKVFSAAF